MSLSRRGFLEVSALSASGLALSNIVPALTAYAEAGSSASDTVRLPLLRLPQKRVVLSMNESWLFFRPKEGAAEGMKADKAAIPPSSASWEPATLPHTVRLEPRDVSGGLNYQGICWYQRSFLAQPEWKERIVYLKFQGAMQVADVYLNGAHITTHYGGYIPFTLDISKSIQFDQPNILVVRLDNSDNAEVPPGKPQSELDFCYFGGLYRSVELDVRDPLHITDPILADKIGGGGIFVTFPKVGEDDSLVQVQTDLANESNTTQHCTIEQELMDMDGEVQASVSQEASVDPHSSRAFSQQMSLRQARLWHPENPHLYCLHTTISQNGKVTDDEFTRIGIRSIRFDKDQGLSINGRPFFSIGANRHQDHPYVGYALPPSAHYRDACKLREAGFTSYRSHYPQDPSFMDACDELGILAIVSNPGWQFVGDNVFRQRVYQDAREMIRRDRNHPSILLWEVALNESDNSSVAAELYRAAHEEFPGPECYTAGDPIRKPVVGFNGWDVGYVGFQHKDPARPSWIREWGDQVDNWRDQQGRVRLQRSWGETPMLTQATAHMLSLNRIYQVQTRPAGANLWAGIDAARGYHHQPFLGGPLDFFRLPKFDYYMFQSQRPPHNSGRVGSGPMVFVANYATFQSPSKVIVFSNCEHVRLTQNGKVVATQTPDSGYDIPHPPFTFKVGDFSETRSMLFQNAVSFAGVVPPVGQLLAEGLIDGKVVAQHIVHSPGEPTNLQLHVDTCELNPVADGADWVRVYAHVCDDRGETHPYADDMVSFSVDGEGSLIGDEMIYANPLRAEAGIAVALVRTTRNAGSITVRAAAPGLKVGVVRFESHLSTRPALA